MTPHEADIAFALEGLAEVAAVYAIAAPTAGVHTVEEPHVEYLVVIQSLSTRGYAEVHARLLTVMTREECGSGVQLLMADSLGEPRYMARARRLTLSPTERDAARARAASRPPPEDDAPPAPTADRVAPWWGAYETLPRARRARVIVLDQWPQHIEPAFLDLDADLVFIHDQRSPPDERLAMIDVPHQIRAGEVDLVLLDVHLARTRGDRICAAMIEQFGPSAIHHLFFMTAPVPPTFAPSTLGGYPRVTKPLDPRKLAFIFENATRWLRPEARSE